MADSRLKIIVDAQDNASGPLHAIGKQVGSLESNVKSAAGGLGGFGAALKSALGPAALGAMAVTVGKTVLDFERMREESAQLEARFVAFTGSTEKADAAFRAFDNTLGDALSKDEKMAAAAQIMGLGLAQTAQEAATLTKHALLLGLDIGTLTQALETGRATGLVKYGISLTDVKARAEELQTATAGLSDIEAKAIAIKEQLALKADAVAAAGGREATAIAELGNAWDTFLDGLADRVNASGFVDWLTRGISALGNALSDEGAKERAYGQAFDAYQSAAHGRIVAERQLQAAIDDKNESMIAYWSTAMQTAQAEETVALAAYKAATEAYNTARGADAATASLGALAAAAGVVPSELDEIGNAAIRNADWLREFKAAADDAAAVSFDQTYGVSLDYIGPDQMEANQFAGEQKRQKIQDQEELARHAATLAKQGATKAANDYNQAFQTMASKVGGYVSDAMGKAKGLLDVTGGKGDITAPGANGPFENIYRLLDVVKLGGASPWAEQFKDLSRAQMQQIAEDFENGQLTDAVKKIIDVPALVTYIKDEQAGQKLRDAFYAEVAGQAGVGKSVVQGLIEPTGDQRTAIGTQATAVAADVAGQLKEQAAQFAVTGGEWMTQLAAGIRGSIPNLTVAASEVVAAFLATVQAAVVGGPGAIPTGAATGASGAGAAAAGGATVPVAEAMAAGGIVRGGVTLVGERGPELVVLPGQSRVYSARDTERLLAPGGSPARGQTLNLTINVSGANRSEARIGVFEALRAAGVS